MLSPRRRFLAAPFLLGPAGAKAATHFTTSDGVRLHLLTAGRGPLLVFVPGWTMPAWMFQPQLEAFAATHRVVAMDPRGQGNSDIPRSGYTAARRGQDIHELLGHLGGGRAVVAGWSLGVLEALACLRAHGESRLAGLVLLDNSIGLGPPPARGNGNFLAALRRARESTTRAFVARMFAEPPGEDYLARLTADSLRTPTEAAVSLLSYNLPREAWRDAVLGTRLPTLYMVTPRLAGQAAELRRQRSQAETVVMEGAGHALFVDQPEAFNAQLADFLRRRVA